MMKHCEFHLLNLRKTICIMAEDEVTTEAFSVNRETTTPFLIRVFVHKRHHFEDKEFKDPTCLPKLCQIHIHTWMDATLMELSNLLTKAVPDFDASRPSEYEVSFALVYPDRKGTMVVKKCGKLSPNSESKDGEKTLKDLKFEIGDFLDVAITPIVNERNGGYHVGNTNSYRRSSYRGGYASSRGGGYCSSYRGRSRGRGRGRGGYRGRGRGSFRNRRY